MLKVDNLHTFYGKIEALKGISLEVHEGEIVTLIGANGAGKSTTLKTLSGQIGPAEGTITFLDTSVQANAGRVQLRATLGNADRYFWPGQFVGVRLVLGIEKNAVLVPSEAVQNSQNGQFVYVIKPDQTVEMRSVTSQRTLDGQTVVKGVEPQETVVTDGQLRLSPGAKVQIKQSPKIAR